MRMYHLVDQVDDLLHYADGEIYGNDLSLPSKLASTLGCLSLCRESSEALKNEVSLNVTLTIVLQSKLNDENNFVTTTNLAPARTLDSYSD
ncbi:hypothetical protein KIN20_026285 [Parelaphostrongylus tenuis]|uniref:Uncharacterized protein n=1 Tax=Parelaphostrongylus tenuis TaxID=148309 RepID=A0AAD5NA50_PARTN|nr:hypothetical protein KIN20_026285 [Parelaphostrongylus tenuis]